MGRRGPERFALVVRDEGAVALADAIEAGDEAADDG